MAPWKPPHHAGCTSVDGFPKDGDPFHWVLGAVFTDHLTCLSYEEFKQSHHCQCIDWSRELAEAISTPVTELWQSGIKIKYFSNVYYKCITKFDEL